MHKSKLTNHAKQNTESLFCLLRIGTGDSKESSLEKTTSILKTPAIKFAVKVSLFSEMRLSSLHLAGSEFQLDSDHLISRFYMKTVHQISGLLYSHFKLPQHASYQMYFSTGPKLSASKLHKKLKFYFPCMYEKAFKPILQVQECRYLH